MVKATLVLEGGAARGIFTSGVLDYLLKEKCYMSDVIGLSAGACNALGYIAKQSGWSRDCLVHENGKFSYYNFKSFFRTKSLMDMELMFDKLPNEKVPFHYESYFSSEMNCTMGIANCLSGEVEYHYEKYDNDRLMTLCKASSSLPIIAPIVKIDDIPYLDGGMVDSIPIKHALSLGNEKLVVILTRNPGYKKSPYPKVLEKIYKYSFRNYPNLWKALNARHIKYNEHLAYLEALEKEGKAFVIRPQIKLIGKMETDPGKLKGLYNHGYEYMEEQYQNLLDYLAN